MLRRANTLLYSVLLMALLGACAVMDVVDPRYDSVNRSTAKARNNLSCSISFAPATVHR